MDQMLANPQISQIELAKKTNLSQSSIAVRLDKLRRSGLIATSLGLDLANLGLKMARVDVSTSHVDAVLEWARACPLYVNSTQGIGGENLSLFLVAEDMEMFQYLVEQHLRKLHGVAGLNFTPILRWSKNNYFPLALNISKTDHPPCGIGPYCPRCPANPSYDGKIWKNRT